MDGTGGGAQHMESWLNGGGGGVIGASWDNRCGVVSLHPCLQTIVKPSESFTLCTHANGTIRLQHKNTLRVFLWFEGKNVHF